MKDFLRKHVYVRLFLRALWLTLLIELLSRKSLFKLGRFVFRSPLAFICNVLIIFMTLLVSRLFEGRHRFVAAVISMIWILFGVVNCVVLKYRMTPFSGEDFNMVPSLMRIAKNYMNPVMIILAAAGLALFLAVIVLLWFKLPGHKVRHPFKRWLFTLAGISVVTAVLSIGINVALQTNELSRNFMNLADAYDRYGFSYCFVNSLMDKGIGRPDHYSGKIMKRIAEGIQVSKEIGVQQAAFLTSEGVTAEEARASDYKVTSSKRPNIIMIQLESFFDPEHIKGYTYSRDPIPNFRAIASNFASGPLTVPVVGAGTANTEFEILTGMSTDYFGAGEYPYNTVLQDRTVESTANVLKRHGYASTVLHNNTGTFYHRDKVFSQMGFDTFIPAEYMYDLETTPNNWAKDKVLTGVIMDTLKDTKSRDFIYAITVQSHGRYPEDLVLEDPLITVECEQETTSLNAVTYYVNEIFEVDEMIGELTAELASYPEPVILAMYGDHLPALGFTPEDLTQDSVYETEYVLWNNFGLDLKDRKMQSESLSTSILSTFGLSGGIIPQFHEVYDGTSVYSRYLNLLEYDMLYGEGYVFRYFADDIGIDQEQIDELETDEPLAPYEASDLSIGYKPIEISRWEIKDDALFVYGSNFTLASRIILDEKPMDTLLIDEGTLQLDGSVPKEFSAVSVGQFDENLVQLGDSTNELEGNKGS